MYRKTLVLPALAGTLATTLVACGTENGQSPSGSGAIVVGTTDQFGTSEETPAPFDPAAVYDVASWNVLRNTFQTLLRLPRSGTEPQLEAAEKCGFADARSEQYRCTLRDGLTFAGGHDLTAKDVVFSVRRVLDIDHDHGPASLLSNIDTVEAPSDKEVVFHLKKPDATFPYKLATPAAAIVDSEVYPAKSLYKGDDVVGSGPYTLDTFNSGKGALLKANDAYRGGLKPQNDAIELRFFKSSQAMEKALTGGDVDLVNRSLSPGQIRKLEDSESVSLVGTPSQGIRYLAFTTDAPAVRDQAVRQAVAQLIDRQELVRDVYQRTAEPLYSIVPGGLPGHRNAFFNQYGEPSEDAARRTLEKAGIDAPVELTLTYTTDHYGPATKDEFEALRDQLNRSGLFKATVQGVPWKKYRAAASEGQYDVYGMGWFPDFPDADNFIAPFFGEGNFLGSPYRNSEITDKLIPRTRSKVKRTAANDDFVRAQDVVADEVPVLPLWQSKQYVAARDGITGVEWALNSSSVLQLWELGRGVQD